MEIFVGDTLKRGLFVPSDRFRLELDGEFTVMVHTLAEGTIDLYTRTLVAEGTEVVAPLLVVPVNDIPGVTTFNQDDPDDWPPQVVGPRAWVFCCHDYSLQPRNSAWFYRRQDLERIVRAEPLLSFAMFDPLTYGTGRVALLFHPAGYVQDAKRKMAADAFMRSRGPQAHLQAGRMGSVRLIIAERPRGIPKELIFASTAEKITFLQRIVATFLRLPRAPDKRFPDTPHTGSIRTDARLLPLGAHENLCLEGMTVQSAAAWSVRRDWRVVEFFGTPGGANIALDLPLVCWTDESYYECFVSGRKPIIAVPRPSQVRGGVTRTGAVCLGVGPLPVWTLAPDQQVPPEMLDSMVGDMPATFNHPTHFREMPSGPLTSVSSRADLQERLSTLGVSRATVEFTFAPGVKLLLNFTQVNAGYAYAVDAASPIINLPPLHRLVLGLTVAVPIALMANPDPAVLRDMHARIMQGRAPTEDLYGNSLRVINPAEVARARDLRPRALPYTVQGALPENWDSREQNPLYALPYVHSQHSPQMLAEIRQAY